MRRVNITTINILAAIFICILIVQGTGLVYFASKSQAVSGRLEKAENKMKSLLPEYNRLGAEEKDFAELKDRYFQLTQNYENMKKDYDAMELDRDNLIRKAKSLLEENGKARESEKRLEEVEASKIAIQKEKDKLIEANAELKDEITKLEGVKRDIAQERDMAIRERDIVKAEYNKSKEGTALRKLNEEISILKKANSQTGESLKKARETSDSMKRDREKEIAALTAEKSRLESENKALSEKLAKLEEAHAAVINEKNTLADELKDLPKRFTEISRQNEKLLKETAEMHYNLGVFYTKNKEYKRAIKEYQQALELEPNDAATHFNIGYIYSEYVLDREKAVSHFRSFLNLTNSNDEDVSWARKYIITWESFLGKKPLR